MKEKKVLKYMVKHSADNTLKGAVCEWLSDMDYDDVRDSLEDLFSHGCVSGMVSSLIYYADTREFYKKHAEEIWDLAIEQAQELGNKNALEMISGFNGYQDSVVGFENIMAWYGFEETARNLADKFGIEV